MNEAEQELFAYFQSHFTPDHADETFDCIETMSKLVRNVRKSGYIEASKELSFCHPRGVQADCTQCFISGINELRILEAANKL